MNLDEAIKLIDTVLKQANMTYEMHVNVQRAFQIVKDKAKGVEHGNDAVPVQQPVQQSE
jgi:hypothetical protein